MIPTVMFLVDSLDHYYWVQVNFDKYAAACQKLKELAYTAPFRLIIKLHPRYADVAVYQRLFEPDGDRIRLETSPSLTRLLQATDLVVLSALSTAILEVTALQVATVMFFSYYPPHLLTDAYHRWLPKAFAYAHNLQELEELILKLLHSYTEREKLIQRQNDHLTDLLKSSGETASRYVADACQELLDNKRHRGSNLPFSHVNADPR